MLLLRLIENIDANGPLGQNLHSSPLSRRFGSPDQLKSMIQARLTGDIVFWVGVPGTRLGRGASLKPTPERSASSHSQLKPLWSSC